MYKYALTAIMTVAVTVVILFGAGCQTTTGERREVSVSTDPTGKLALVKDGASVAPIVVFEDAPPLTRRAADELAYYIEKISGAKPDVIEGRPDPVPEHAIWVGYQPVLDELFPDLDFDFEHPEEILISANSNHLVIAGRDVWDPDHLVLQARFHKINGVQQEYGTHNAVYTFLQDYLDVRWFWPGDLGEDVIHYKTIAFAPFTYRYHPQVLARGALLAYSPLHRTGPGGPEQSAIDTSGADSGYWMRAQRLQLDSLSFPGGGGFGDWWERFHETHPEYFALQPDGTRSLCTKPGNAKMCVSNPAVWEQWVADVETELEQNPNQRVFNVAPGDGYHSGHCICPDCRAWDHPDGEPRHLRWEGVSQKYVSLTERHVILANKVARRLKEIYPDRDFYAYTYAYGHTRPPPVEVAPEDNVIVGDVAIFLLRAGGVEGGSIIGSTHREHYKGWGEVTDMHFWRPNVGSPVGFQWGMPDIPLQRTIRDIKFAAEYGMRGIYVDYVREFWSTQGPLYYLMAQLVWNPDKDGQAVLDDYYRRAFGPAATEMEAYWSYMEDVREACYDTSEGDISVAAVCDYYNEERLDEAYKLIDAAGNAAESGKEVYRERVAFVKAGLDFTRLYTECGRLMNSVDVDEEPDNKTRKQVIANWEDIRELQQEFPGAMRWRNIFGGSRGDGPPSRFYPEK